jgi:hypothetical protein
VIGVIDERLGELLHDQEQRVSHRIVVVRWLSRSFSKVPALA